MSAPRHSWIAGLGIALSSCSGQPPAVADPLDGVPLAQQRTISRTELGYKWPFEAGTGTIACDGGALFFRSAGTTYALSKGAGTRGYPAADAITRAQGSGPPSDPAPGVTQDVRMKIFAQLAACGEAGAAPAAARECKARIGERNRVPEADLGRIEAEGAERYWPPLKPPLMSLDAIVDAARQLCPH